jgi:hypothetical protein
VADLENLTEKEKEVLDLLLNLDTDTVDRLQKVAREDERMEWLWAVLRRVASTVAIILGAVVMFFEQLKSFIRGIVGG